MRFLIRSALIMVVGFAPSAAAQRLAPAVTAPSRVAPATSQRADGMAGAAASRVSWSAPSASDSTGHAWTRYPLIGAIVGGVGFELLYLSQCRHDNSDGCMGGLAPGGFGLMIGAVVGGVVELIRR